MPKKSGAVEIKKLKAREIFSLLRRSSIAHLACCVSNHPYIIPLRYVFREPFAYIYTIEGKKTDILARNPEVCMQVESIKSPTNWRSVIMIGKAERIVNPKSFADAMALIQKRNPRLMPARGRTWKDDWGFQRVDAIYRIHPIEITGRKAR
jgi:nitroimidazol reductase NimA-like FMN-containing flavoprotein (pyridoxamine 5'-phosphate oxidase superfamily)